MDLPYSHRLDLQSLPKSNQSLHIFLDQEVVSKFRIYARERMNIRYKKQHNEAKPRTQDIVLQHYKFCNVYRELDKQTLFIHKVLLAHKDNLRLWFLNLIIFRCLESIETFSLTGLHDGIHCDAWFYRLNNTARPRFGTAYIFPPQIPKKCGYNTREERLAYFLPSIIDNLITEISSWNKVGIVDGANKLVAIFGVNIRFHITEFLIDLSYQFPQYINLWKPFHIGPGALPTMRSLNSKANPSDVCQALVQTQPTDFPYLRVNEKPIYLSAEAIEGLACEFRKYTNLKNGSGRKRRY